jgi:hypothetical protein
VWTGTSVDPQVPRFDSAAAIRQLNSEIVARLDWFAVYV